MIDKYFWIIVILVTSINGLIWWFKSKKYIAENPELEEGYKKLIKGFLFYGNIPWLFLGLFVLTGSIKTPFEILEPTNLNIGVILWHLSVFGILGLGTYWIFFNNGAVTLEKHPGLFQSSFNRDGKISASAIKFFWILGLIGAVIGEIMMWTMNFN
jgi:hypothetical protein